MFKLDSSTIYILFVFFLLLLVIIYAYDDVETKYQYQNKKLTRLSEDNENQYYIYNQITVDDIYPSYM
jgi:hypothetical protein